MTGDPPPADPYDRYYYGGTDVLINRNDIRDPAELNRVEYATSTANTLAALDLAQSLEPGADMLKAIHATLLGELYEWAGHFRTIPAYKNSTQFQPAVSEERVDAACARFMEKAPPVKEAIGPFAGALARLWSDLNYEHPFVEGNGRSTQILLTEMARRMGWEIRWKDMRRADELDAAIQSCMLMLKDRRFNGFHDLLIRLLDRAKPFGAGAEKEKT